MHIATTASMPSSIGSNWLHSSPSKPRHGVCLCRRRTKVTVMNSKAEGPSLRRPSPTPIQQSPSSGFAPPPPPPPTSEVETAPAAPSDIAPSVTVEYQRQRAKEMQSYFAQKKFDDQFSRNAAFGFMPKNEISNGRWAMFGFAVGLLTEYATGSNFVDQMKILLSNFGIADLD